MRDAKIPIGCCKCGFRFGVHVSLQAPSGKDRVPPLFARVKLFSLDKQFSCAYYSRMANTSTAARVAATKHKQRKPFRSLRGHARQFDCALRKIRKELGLTLRDVEKGSGVNLPGIWRCEIGAEVELSKALKLAKFFGVPVEQLWKLKDGASHDRARRS